MVVCRGGRATRRRKPPSASRKVRHVPGRQWRRACVACRAFFDLTYLPRLNTACLNSDTGWSLGREQLDILNLSLVLFLFFKQSTLGRSPRNQAPSTAISGHNGDRIGNLVRRDSPIAAQRIAATMVPRYAARKTAKGGRRWLMRRQ
jgi:hypothetical protein